MKKTQYLAVVSCLLLLGCDKPPAADDPHSSESISVEKSVPPATGDQAALVVPPNDNSKPFVVSVLPRQQEWKTTDTLLFDVVFYNNTDKPVVVDPFWKRMIECDGKRYVDITIPKPKFRDNLVPYEPHSLVKWTLGINGPYKIVDAETGKDPLVLKAGKHQLVLIQGEHRSNAVSFTLVE